MHLGAGRVPQAGKTNKNQPPTYPGQHFEKISMDQIVLRDFFTFSCFFFLGPSETGAERGAAPTGTAVMQNLTRPRW